MCECVYFFYFFSNKCNVSHSVASFYLCVQMCNFVAFLCVACDFVAASSRTNIYIYKFCTFFGLSDRIIIGGVC